MVSGLSWGGLAQQFQQAGIGLMSLGGGVQCLGFYVEGVRCASEHVEEAELAQLVTFGAGGEGLPRGRQHFVAQRLGLRQGRGQLRQGLHDLRFQAGMQGIELGPALSSRRLASGWRPGCGRTAAAPDSRPRWAGRDQLLVAFAQRQSQIRNAARPPRSLRACLRAISCCAWRWPVGFQPLRQGSHRPAAGIARCQLPLTRSNLTLGSPNA